MRRAALVVLLAVGLLPAGCGGGPDAREVLADTVEGLERIDSATLAMSLVIRGADGGDAGATGFELRGPVSLQGDGPFPVARLEYTQIAGTARETVTLVATGREAFVEVDGRAYALPEPQADLLRAARADLGDGDGALPLADWIADPAVSQGGTIDGVPTRRVTGRVDVLAALDAVRASMAGSGPASIPVLGDADRELVARATRRATIDLRTGRDDHLLRRLALDVDFETDPPPALRQALGSRVGLRIDLRLGLDDLNRPVDVGAPVEVLPPEALPSRG